MWRVWHWAVENGGHPTHSEHRYFYGSRDLNLNLVFVLVGDFYRIRSHGIHRLNSPLKERIESSFATPSDGISIGDPNINLPYSFLHDSLMFL